jgi:OmcA/MtrC family decaheme c-type cytochrome
MNRVALTLAGPTTDYKTYFNESAIASTAAGNDFVYNFNNAIPADAKGTFVIAIEGYKNITLNAGTRKEMVVRDSGVNKMLYFSVDGSKVTPRRTVVSTAKCNACHGDLSIHGGNRRGDVQYCATCHNPVMTDVARRTKPELLPAESINFKTMVHKIHTGHQLTSDLTIYGYGNTAHNYNEVGYPGDRRNCAACHEGTSYQIPLAEGLLASVAPRDYINPMQPETGACLSCHTQKYVAAHALTNTSTALGEACATCHGPNAEKSVVRAHAR